MKYKKYISFSYKSIPWMLCDVKSTVKNQYSLRKLPVDVTVECPRIWQLKNPDSPTSFFPVSNSTNNDK